MSRRQRREADSGGHARLPWRPRRSPTVGIACGVLVTLALGWVLLGWLIVGDRDAVDPAADGVLGQTPEPIRGLTNERFFGSLATEMERVSPRQDDWESEAFSEAAAAQLKLLGELVTSEAIDRERLAPLLAGGFSCSRLRPLPLEQVFDDGDLVVRRPPQDGERHGATTSYTGSAGLRAALETLLGAHEALSPKRLTFKVVQVEAGSVEASTGVLCQLFAQGPETTLEQNAVWKCRWERAGAASPPRLLLIDVADFEEVELTARRALFSDCTESLFGDSDCYREQLQYGLDHWRDRFDWRFGWEVVGPHGLAVGDVNGDGLDDVFVCETGGLPNRLLVQQEDGSVRDVSAQAGVDYIEPTYSALLVDLDNDADEDLIMACGTYLLAFENDGSARFTWRYHTSSTSLIRSIAAADYDLDGALDIYVCGYSSRQAALDGVGLGRPMPYHDANNGAPNYLLRNRGNWSFDDVTARVGLDSNNRRFSYAASWGDYNRDGLADLYVGNMFSSAGHRIAYQRRFKEDAASGIRALYQRHARGNTLFENAGDGTFRDVSLAANVTRGRWAWSSSFVDLNSDGWEDIVVANGMITGEDDPEDL